MRKKHHFPIPHIREENHEVNTIVAKLPSNLGPVIMYRQGFVFWKYLINVIKVLVLNLLF